MASHPGTSRRCDECRRRRKKCGLEEPACHRCLSRGIKCSGPNNLPIYVNRNAANLQTQSHRGALKLAMQVRATATATASDHQSSDGPPGSANNATKHTKRTRTVAHDAHERLKQLIERTQSSLLGSNAILATQPYQLFYSTVLEAFQPREKTGIFSADRSNSPEWKMYSSVALCIRALLPLALAGRQLLDMSIFSLLTMYMGKLVADSKLIELARSAYTTAVGKFHHFIGSTFPLDLRALKLEHSQLCLSLSTALQVFEFINDPEGNSIAFLTHYDGMLNLLELAGPEVYQSPHLFRSINGIRGIMIYVALEKRQPLILARPEWSPTLFLRRPQTKSELLHNIALRLPELLKRVDELDAATASGEEENKKSDASQHPTDDIVVAKGGSPPDRLAAAAQNLLEDLREVRSDLEEWFHAIKKWHSTPLYWQADEAMDRQYMKLDPQCVPDFTDTSVQLRYPDGQKACLLVGYWSFLVETLTAMMYVRSVVVSRFQLSAENGENEEEKKKEEAISRQRRHEEEEEEEEEEEGEEEFLADRAAADEAASLIIQSVPYLLCCLEGLCGAQQPLRLVARYTERRGKNEWLAGRGTRIAIPA